MDFNFTMNPALKCHLDIILWRIYINFVTTISTIPSTWLLPYIKGTKKIALFFVVCGRTNNVPEDVFYTQSNQKHYLMMENNTYKDSSGKMDTIFDIPFPLYLSGKAKYL